MTYCAQLPRVTGVALLAAMASFALPVSAATVTFVNPSSSCLPSSSTGGVSYSAWSNTGTGGTIEAATLRAYSGGLGVTNARESCGSSPSHSVDNYGYVDSILFDFGAAVDLNSVSFGWVSGDSDFSLFRYVSGSPAINGLTYGTLSGWQQANYTRNGSTGTTTVNTSNLYSRYWLVTASLANGGTGSYSCSNGYDCFKIQSMDYTPVPLPAAGWLLLSGLAGFGALARRRRVG